MLHTILCNCIYNLKIVQIAHCLKCFYLQFKHGVQKSWDFIISFKVNSIYSLYIFNRMFSS
jgi:hypothetical protein